MPVKDNQANLRAEVESVFASKKEPKNHSKTFFRKAEKAHGREEERKVWVTANLEALEVCQQWPGLKCLVKVESHRREGNNEKTVENRYYIVSRELTTKQAAESIRNHWSVENACHWVLDVTLKEDKNTIYDGYAAENMSLIRSVVLNALKQTEPPN